MIDQCRSHRPIRSVLLLSFSSIARPASSSWLPKTVCRCIWFWGCILGSPRRRTTRRILLEPHPELAGSVDIGCRSWSRGMARVQGYGYLSLAQADCGWTSPRVSGSCSPDAKQDIYSSPFGSYGSGSRGNIRVESETRGYRWRYASTDQLSRNVTFPMLTSKTK